MANYRIKGARFLRKYTEPQVSPTSAAAIQAQRIVNSLCDLPWERVQADLAQTAFHEDAQLDTNVEIRDRFDAALFCAEHKDGMHRAYANAAVYCYELPDSAVGLSLSSLKVQVNTDYFNSSGVRLHVFTANTLEIPMSCRTVRGEDSSGEIVDDGTTASGVAKRTVRIVNNQEKWYTTSETVTLEPIGGLALQKYLFLLVALESYSTVRGNWLEGSSYIDNDVIIALESACADLDANRVNDLSPVDQTSAEFPVMRGGIIPSGAVILRTLEVRIDADPIAEDSDGSQTPIRAAVGTAAASALSRLYADFFAGKGRVEMADAAQPAVAFFSVHRTFADFPTLGSDRPQPTEILRIEAAAMLVPFVLPYNAALRRLSLGFAALSCATGARFNVLLAPGEYLTTLADKAILDSGIFDGRATPYPILGSFDSGTAATFDFSGLLTDKDRVATAIIAGWLPPEAYSLTTGGTTSTGLLTPDVTII